MSIIKNKLPHLSFFLLIFVSSGVWAHCAGNHTGSHPHCNGGGSSGGDQDPVFKASSADPAIPAVLSHSLDPGDVIVFRSATVDLRQFKGTFPNDAECDHGIPTGTLSIRPESADMAGNAILRFGFSSELNDGDTAHHLFIMNGTFDEPGNWPPKTTDPHTTLTLTSWDFTAEKKRAKRKACAGSSPDPSGATWSVTVELQ